MKQFIICLLFCILPILNISSQNSLDELNIVFKHNFDNNTLGDYKFSEWNADFRNPQWNNRQSTLDIVQNNADPINGSKALKIYYPANSLQDSEGGCNWNTLLDKKYEEIYVSYDVLFMPGFQFALGGKLPSVKAGTVEIYGDFNRPDGFDGFAGGLMFNSKGNITFYIYYPDSKLDMYGESFLWGTIGYPANYFSPSIINYGYGKGTISNGDPGTWHNITYRIVANSIKSEGVGNYDGILEAYFDGVLVSQVSKILWRRTANLGIDCFRMCTFFGGGTDEWRNPIDEWIEIDNILLYTFKDGVNVPRGNTLSPTNRTINYWRKIENGVLTQPNAPSNINSSNITKNSATIKWTDNSSNETGFKIYRSESASSDFILVGTASSNVTQYTSSDLTANTTYYFKVLAYNSDGNSSFSALHSLTTLPLQIPVAPSNMSSKNITKTSVTLTWKDNSNNETGFSIFYSLSAGGSLTHIANVGANISEFIHSSLTPATTYYYRVRAYNSDGSSSLTPVYSITTLALQIPLPPSDLASASITKNSATIKWTDNSTNETGFDIYYSLSANGNYTKVGTTAANINEFVHSPLNNSTTYYYKVLAFNLEGSSDLSSPFSLTTLSLQVPSAPSDVNATNIKKKSATIFWTDNSINEYGFEVYASLSDSGEFIKIGSTPSNITEFIVSTLTPNTKYYYRILAYNGDGVSDSSSIFSFTTLPLEIPAAPSNLRTLNPEISQIILEWDDNSNNEEGFEIEKSEGDADHFKLFMGVSQNQTSFVDNNIISNSNYYRIRSVNSDGISNYSDTLFVELFINDLPEAPTRLNILSVGYDKTTLRWHDNSNNENGFEIERHGPDDELVINYFSVTTNDSIFVDNRLSMNSKYTYFVRSFNNNGYSDYSNKVIIKTLSIDLPAAPTELKTSKVTQSSIMIEWEDNSNNEVAYYVKRSLASDTNNIKLITLNANSTNYVDQDLEMSTNYIYTVFASNKAGNSPASNIAVGYTLSQSVENRIKDGLIAYYDFSYEPDMIYQDKSENQEPLNLYSHNSNYITWHGNNSVELSSDAYLKTIIPANKITQAFKSSNEITVECWFKPSEPLYYADSRVISLSDASDNLGFALNQSFFYSEGNPTFNYGVRLKTTSTNQYGDPEFRLNKDVNYINLLHLIYTKDTLSNEKLYLNGVMEAENYRSGSVNVWANDYYLCLGSSPDNNNPWSGSFYTVAFYNKALTDSQILKNYSAGPTDNLVVYKNDYSVYVTPNPVTDYAKIEIIPSEIQDIAPETIIRILDMYGNKYYEEIIFDPGNIYSKTIDFSNYPKGVYAIQLLSYNTQQTTKFIIE